LEQDFEIATHEYEYINNALKQDLPRFMMLSTQFIDPLFNSFFYMQWVTLWSCLTTRNSEKSYQHAFVSRLNIFYIILEKMNSFADEFKYDISNVPGAQIAQEYEEKRTDAWSVIENLGIVKRIISVCKFDDYTLYVFCLRGVLQRGWSRRRVLRVNQVWGAQKPHLRLPLLPI